eukprot:GAHX01001266.1.p1 GENE.GAHX01001266.1~~GAHX01001266.1.p1  ORF type:complete len:373 (-),score=91.66 GAHX01001266.1:24-1142(-)
MFSKAKKNILSSIGSTKLGRKAILGAVDEETKNFIADLKELVQLFYGHKQAVSAKTKLLKFAVKFDTAAKEKKIDVELIKSMSDDLTDCFESLLGCFKAIKYILDIQEAGSQSSKNDVSEIEVKLNEFQVECGKLELMTYKIFDSFLSSKNKSKLRELAKILTDASFIKEFLTSPKYSEYSEKILNKSVSIFGDVSFNLTICSEDKCPKIAAKMPRNIKYKHLTPYCNEHMSNWFKGIESKDAKKRLVDVLAHQECFFAFGEYIKENKKDNFIELNEIIYDFKVTNSKSLKLRKIRKIIGTFKGDKSLSVKYENEIQTIEDKEDEGKIAEKEIRIIDGHIFDNLLVGFNEFLESDAYKEFRSVLVDVAPEDK